MSVEPFHLFRYLDEQTFRFNERKGKDADRFVQTVKQIAGKRLTFDELIGKKSGHCYQKKSRHQVVSDLCPGAEHLN